MDILNFRLLFLCGAVAASDANVYSFSWAHCFTFTTGYAFCVTNFLAIHEASSLTSVTANAFAFINLHGENTELVKDCIKCA